MTTNNKKTVSITDRVFTLQVEEPSILSDTEDAVDSRQWTQHHLAAADIRMPPSMALTPPQGEFDGDCMDVNVRGPGTIYKKKKNFIFYFGIRTV